MDSQRLLGGLLMAQLRGGGGSLKRPFADITHTPFEVVRDLAYGPDANQCLDVYRSPDASNAPVLFMVHGGAWMAGDKGSQRVIEGKVLHWLPKGYILVSVNYRFVPAVNVLQQRDDLAAALAYVQAHAAEWGGDPSRVVLMGHSAGAHLLGLLAAGADAIDDNGQSKWRGAVLLDSAAIDVVSIMSAVHPPFYDRVFGSDPAYWQCVSPYHCLNTSVPPMLVVCSQSRERSMAAATRFARKAAQLGGAVQVLPVMLSHQEINEKLGEDATYTAEVDRFLSSLGLP